MTPSHDSTSWFVCEPDDQFTEAAGTIKPAAASLFSNPPKPFLVCNNTGNAGNNTGGNTGDNTAHSTYTPPSFIQDSKDATMADEDQNKILGFTKREAEILIMSIQVIKPNQCTTNGCTVSSDLRRHTPSSITAGAGLVPIERIWSHRSQDITGQTCRPHPHRSLQRRRDGAYQVRCSEG